MRARFAKFIKLPGSERKLLACAFLALIKARLSIARVPIGQLLQPLARRHAGARAAIDAARVGWAIEVVSALVPGLGNCLLKALAGRALLARYGLDGQIRIGVDKNSFDSLRAHAWLECEERIITGAGEHHDFSPMPLEQLAASSSRDRGMATTATVARKDVDDRQG